MTKEEIEIQYNLQCAFLGEILHKAVSRAAPHLAKLAELERSYAPLVTPPQTLNQGPAEAVKSDPVQELVNG